MERGKMSSSGRGGKSKVPQHPQDIFALGSKSTVPVSRDSEKRNIHKPSTSNVDRKRDAGTSFGAPPPGKRSRIGSPAESVCGTSLEVDPVDLVPHVLQALDTHNSDKLLGLLTGSIRLLKSQRSKPDPILCMSMLYLCKIRPNMFAHDTVTQSLCCLLKREQGTAFKSKGNPLVFVMACNMLYAGHRENKNWPDIFIKVYIEDALNERWWVDCSWCKCLVENITTAFNTKIPPPHLIPTDSTLGTMSPSGSGSPLIGTGEEDTDNTDLEYTVFPRYSSIYENVEGLVLEAIKEQIQRRAAPDAIGKGFLKLLSATCGFPEIRMISASRLEGWLHSGKLWRAAQELLAHVCVNADATGPTAARDHEVLAQLARMRLKTKPLVAAYVSCLREMVSESGALLRSVVTHTIYNELSNVRSPNNMAVLAALIQAQPQLVPQAMGETYLELLVRPEDYVRPLRVLIRECVRGARSDAGALVPLARTLANKPHHDPPAEVRERAFTSLAELFCTCCLVVASVHKSHPEWRSHVSHIQGAAVSWLLDLAGTLYRPTPQDYLHALNKILFMESAEAYSKVDNWPPESERAAIYRLCCELPLPQHTLLRIIFIGLTKEIPVSPSEAFSLVEGVVRRAGALEEGALTVDSPDLPDLLLQLTHYHPPDNVTLPHGYTVPPLAISSLYWRAWSLLVVIAAHNPHGWAERAAITYPTLRALIEYCITNKPSIEWTTNTSESEAERAAILQLETHLAAASNAKLPVTEHNCRLLSQLTTLDPQGPARRPPAPVLEALQQLATSLRLGRLLCRQPALLLDLVERHGTRRAMPWLHHLLQHEQLELSVLPVQCVCELVCAGVGSGRGQELVGHLRGVVRGGREGARAVLHHYLARLHHHHPPTRAHANRGLKLVLTQTEETEIDYNEEVNPETWLEALYTLPSWEAVRDEAIIQLRAACLVETNPAHLSAYIRALARHVEDIDGTHTAIVLDLSQVVMERTCVMGATLPPTDRALPHDAHHAAHRTLHALTRIFTTHIKKVHSLEGSEEMETEEVEGEKISVRGGGRLHLVLAHACLKLLCYGPSLYDTGHSLYQWLVSLWTGDWLEEQEESVLPDWLRLHLIRSAKPQLLAAGLRGLPAHKLALFIQTFGMPVSSMSGLLQALDACPAASVLRLGVERGYMCQLLGVQRARGARGGDAFAAALHLTPTTYPPDVDLFTPAPRPKETTSVWSSNGPIPVSLRQVTPTLTMVFSLAHTLPQDVHDTLAQIYTKITQEANSYLKKGSGPTPYTDSVISFLKISSNDISTFGAALIQRVAYSAPLLRALVPFAQYPRALLMAKDLVMVSERLLSLYKGAVSPLIDILKEMSPLSTQPDSQLPVLPSGATKEQLIAALESSTSNTLEEIGNRIIATQNIETVTEVLTHILEKSQSGGYEVKSEGQRSSEGHVLGRKGRGCGLVLDWLADLLPEILGPKPESQIKLMFRASGGSGAVWRPLLVTLLAHRASWDTLHTCLTTLLQDHSNCVPSWVVQFCETLVRSPRVCQGRDPHTPRHHIPDDILALDYKQIGVLVSYVIAEMREAGSAASTVCNSRLSLVVQCAATPPALLAASLAPFNSGRELDDIDHLFLLLLYMKRPVMSRLVSERWRPSLSRAPPTSPGVGDKVSHTLLTALAHLARQGNNGKEHHHKVSLLESGARGWWVRGGGVGARGVAVVCGLLRANAHPDPALSPLLSILEPLDDETLFDHVNTEELHDILSCYLNAVSQQTSSNQLQQQLLHRLSALLRRYVVYKPNEATELLNNYREVILSTPALSPLLSVSSEGPPASWAPPPGPLATLAARSAPPDVLLTALQEIEWWGSRRGGAWGGAGGAGAVAGAAGGLGAHPCLSVRTAALSLLAKLLPALHDTTPGLRVVLECLDSEQPEIAQSVLDKLSELICGMQEHAGTILTKVFVLGMKGRLTVDQALSKCVATINMLRGC